MMNQANKDNDVVSVILGTLIQANRLRDPVKLDAIELKSAKLVRKTPRVSASNEKKRRPQARLLQVDRD